MNKTSYILLAAVVVLLLFSVNQCIRTNKLDINNTKLEMANKELKEKNFALDSYKKDVLTVIDGLKHRNDSLVSIRGKALSKWKKSTDDLISVVHNSDCYSISKAAILAAVDSAKSACDAALVADSMLINNQSNIIKEQNKVIATDSVIIDNKDAIIDNLEKETLNLKKKVRREKFRTVVVGTIGAVATAFMAYLAITH